MADFTEPMSIFRYKPDIPRIFIQGGVLATLALIPVWYRLPYQPPFLASLYVSRFLIFMPMLWTIACWLIFRLPGFDVLRRDTLRAGWALALLLLALWALASPLWAFQRDAHPEVAENASVQLGVVALFIIVVASVAPPPRTIVGTLVVSVLWNSFVTLGQVITQGSIGLRALGEFPLGVNQPGISYVQVGVARWLRPYSLLPHPNMLAGFFAIGLLAILVWVISNDRRLRWIGLLVFTLGLWGFSLTFSRAAWIGLAAGLFAVIPPVLRTNAAMRAHLEQPFLAFSASWWFKLLLVAVITMMIGAAFAVTFRPLLAARAGVGEESVELRSISDRLVFARFAYDSILERPIIGVGMGNFPWRSSYYIMRTNYDLRGDNVHHTLLSAWAELGLVGWLLLVVALVLGVEAALRNIRSQRLTTLTSIEADSPIRQARGSSDSGQLSATLALFAGFMALIAIGLFDHYPWTILHFQVAWWGLLAVAGKPSTLNSPPVSPGTEMS